MSGEIKIMLVDDHPLLTAGMKMMIEGWDEYKVCGTAVSGNEAVEKCETDLPDIILMDMQMPGLSGHEAGKIIKKKWPKVRVVALTTFDDSETVCTAMDSGFDGFLLKTISPEALRNSLQAIYNGINVFDEDAMKRFRNRKNVQLSFTERETTILRLICNGKTNKEIAEQLLLQPGTVKNIVSLLLNKTYCISRAELVKYAFENNLVE